MKDLVDERSTPRLAKDVTIFIQMQSASTGRQFEEDILICKSVDLSVHGLQVALDRSIPEGRILRLCLDIKNKAPIFVVAEVIWLLEGEDSKDYHVGFKLLDSKGSDLADWQQAISEIFSA